MDGWLCGQTDGRTDGQISYCVVKVSFHNCVVIVGHVSERLFAAAGQRRGQKQKNEETDAKKQLQNQSEFLRGGG